MPPLPKSPPSVTGGGGVHDLLGLRDVAIAGGDAEAMSEEGRTFGGDGGDEAAAAAVEGGGNRSPRWYHRVRERGSDWGLLLFSMRVGGCFLFVMCPT